MKKNFIPAFRDLSDLWKQISSSGNRLTFICLLFIFQMVAVNTYSQNDGPSRTIQGKITDESSAPMPGVTVMERGTSNGTISNSNGDYSIEVQTDTARLVFSFVGMEKQTVNTEGKTSIDVEMVPSSVSLDEVVAVGYGTVSKKNLTTSISKVNTDDVSKSANSNMSQLLYISTSFTCF